MGTGRKPRLITDVAASVRLANGRYLRENWETPVSFHRCLAKVGKWIREALRDQKVPGRGQISEITVVIQRTDRVWEEEA